MKLTSFIRYHGGSVALEQGKVVTRLAKGRLTNKHLEYLKAHLNQIKQELETETPNERTKEYALIDVLHHDCLLKKDQPRMEHVYPIMAEIYAIARRDAKRGYELFKEQAANIVAELDGEVLRGKELYFAVKSEFNPIEIDMSAIA